MGIIMKKANRNKTLKLAFIGIMCALTTVVTWVLPIPMPATEGYINFGDAVIFLTALFAGPVPAMVVGGIGSMLADVIGGYMHWAGFTLLIKGLEGLICGLIVKKLNKKTSSISTFSGLSRQAYGWLSATISPARFCTVGRARLKVCPATAFRGACRLSSRTCCMQSLKECTRCKVLSKDSTSRCSLKSPAKRRTTTNNPKALSSIPEIPMKTMRSNPTPSRTIRRTNKKQKIAVLFQGRFFNPNFGL